MVSDIVHHRSSVETLPIDDDDNESSKQHDVVSITSVEDDDGFAFACNAVAVPQNDHLEVPTFGNIAVSNSSEIHFGNKTYYQGPVTIKKIVYAGPDAVNNDLENNSVAGISNGKCQGNENLSCDIENCAVPDEKSEKPKKNVENFKKISICYIRKYKSVIITVIICALTMIVAGIVLSVLLESNSSNVYPTDSDELDNRTPIHKPVDPIDLPPGKLKIISRQEWLAQLPTHKLDPLETPVPNVIIWHTATNNCTDQSSCTFIVRQVQAFHIQSRNWWDIGYNFLVGGDGYIYEGRGWKSEGSHTLNYNKNSIGIALIGTFTNYLPPKRQINGAKKLIQLGVNESYIIPDYKLFAARQLSSTESPGQLLYEDIITWPHWTNTSETQ